MTNKKTERTMKQGDKILFTLKGGSEWVIECVRKDEPRYTYHHTYIVATTYKAENSVLFLMALALAEEDRCNTMWYEGYNEMANGFKPYFKVSELKKDSITSFVIDVVFPNDD